MSTIHIIVEKDRSKGCERQVETDSAREYFATGKENKVQKGRKKIQSEIQREEKRERVKLKEKGKVKIDRDWKRKRRRKGENN